VLFEKIDGLLHFESKLVGLQLFTRDSGHSNLSLESALQGREVEIGGTIMVARPRWFRWGAVDHRNPQDPY